MSRLYTRIYSDTSKTPKTMTGHEISHLDVFYGSKDNSKLLANINVTWCKGSDKPIMTVNGIIIPL